MFLLKNSFLMFTGLVLKSIIGLYKYTAQNTNVFVLHL